MTDSEHTAVEAVASFLKERDENVLPGEADDEERKASAQCIVRVVAKFSSPTNLENAERAEMTMTPHAYAQEYEFRGDVDYTPSDFERTMIEDAILGYLGEVRIRSCLLDKPEAGEVVKGWRVFENISPGEFGIEDLADPDGDAILPPRRIDREHLDRIVSAYNAACHGGTAAKPVRSPPPVAAATPNEITDFLYKHGDLTYSAASSAIRLLIGNGYGFTRAAIRQRAEGGK